MTKRRIIRWSLFLVLLAAFAVWLEPTRVVWGRLRGEAFYQGRPTSYWREQCDAWLDRFEDHDSLTSFTWLLPFEVPAAPGLRMFGIPEDLQIQGCTSIRNPRETFLKRLTDRLRGEDAVKREQDYYFAPRILWATPDTEPVLLELQQEEKYRWLATLALRRVADARETEAELKKESEGVR